MPIIMGILNLTPDSFSDGGLYNETQVALAHAREMIEQGAHMVDVGGIGPMGIEIHAETAIMAMVNAMRTML